MCRIEGCDRPERARSASGLCNMHASRMRRNGSPDRPPKVDIVDRVLSKVNLVEGGCWLWTAPLTPKGYGQLKAADGKSGRAHRVVWETLVGPVPEGLHLDHLCRVRSCVNPDHLEPVTPGENALRGITIAAANAAKTQCESGHPFTPENTYVRPRGERACRTCRRAAEAARSPRRRRDRHVAAADAAAPAH